MENQRDPQTWREFLGQLTKDPKEKERILQQAGIQPTTLTRWIKGSCTPRAENIHFLLQAIPPNFSQTFTQLLSVDFPNLEAEQMRRGSVQPEPPLEFYKCVLTAYINSRPPLYPQTLRDLILQQMIKQFDPHCFGLSIRIAQCLWHRNGGKIRSLQVIGGIGTPPWNRNLDQRVVLLGAESLAGVAVMKCRLIAAARQVENSLPNHVHWEEHEQSMLAYPLMFQGKIAGSLLIASAQADAFHQAHHKLLEHYAHMMALAFEPDTFFDPKDISLHIMPPYTHQEPLFGQFRQRSLQIVRRYALSLSKAHERVWQEIEEELIQLVGTDLA